MTEETLIAGLHPDLQVKARAHREKAGFPILFTAGRRSWSEQIHEYEKGRARTSDGWVVVDPSRVVTFALPVQAPHCRGAAYDIVPIVNEKEAWDRLDLFAELGRIGKLLGLVWGGDFQKIKDCPHFEMPGWRTLPMPREIS